MIPRPFCLSLKKRKNVTRNYTPRDNPAGQGQLPWSSKHQVPTEDSNLRPNLIWIHIILYIYIYDTLYCIIYIYIYMCWFFPKNMSVFKPCQWRWSSINLCPGDCRTPSCLCSTHTPGRSGSAKAAISIFCLIKGRKPPPPVGCCRDQVFPHLFLCQGELITPRWFTENHNGFYWKIKDSTSFLMQH